MKQHQVILSIGSNQGNRLENIIRSLQYIHTSLGTIVRVSSLYETPSWGFDSVFFYNAAILLHTTATAQQVLTGALAIEKKMGRVNRNKGSYRDRIIDIDLIAYDTEIITTEVLKIPHPLMQHRRFVLVPMLDLDLDWVHPILNQSVATLLETTLDKSSCTLVQNLAVSLF